MGIEVRIISLDKHTNNHPVKVMFPQAKYFKAIDTRNSTPKNLLDNRLITLNGFENLKNGRKYHHELPSTGCIGLSLSMWHILKSGNEPILICEDDCLPSPILPHVIDEIYNSSDIDMVVFGPIMYKRSEDTVASFIKGFDMLNSYFWGTHAILFTSSGRKKASKYLEPPVDVQVDALFSRLAMYSDYKVIIQAPNEAPLAKQKPHTSTLQNYCPLCERNPKDTMIDSLSILIICVVLLLLLVIFSSRTNQYFSKAKRMLTKKT